MNRRGFTLLELMVAVFITSIVVIAAYSLMTGSSSSFQDEQDRRLLESNLRNAELMIQRDLSRIGYRVPFDTDVASGSPSGKIIDSGMSNFKAFYVYKPGTNYNSTHVNNKNVNYHDFGDYKFAGFTIIGNFTDYDGFEVSSASGNELTINPALTLALTASDIGSLTATVRPTRMTTSEAGFDAAFKRAFKHALAVQISSSTYEWVVTKLESYSPNNDAASGSTEGENTNENENADPSAITTYTVKVASSAPNDYGFSDTYNNTLVNPIQAITYKVVDNNIHGTEAEETEDNNGARYDLIRCYNKDLINPTLNPDRLEDCVVLLHNLVYFDIYPLVPHMEGTSPNEYISSYMEEIFTNETYNVAKRPVLGTDTAYNAFWEHAAIKDIRGVYYRIGLASDKKARTRLGSTTTAVGVNNQPAFTKNGRPMMHIQGTAVIKTPNTASSESTTLAYTN